MSDGMVMFTQLLPLLLLIPIMWFLLIRPQRKKDKAINKMRNSVKVGDEIITIGGICGKVVRTKDDSLVIQVGADKVKFEIMRWAVSKITYEAAGKASSYDTEEEHQKRLFRRESRRRKIQPRTAI